jgi:O-methyltransferase involved in polyketide biosynthesis
MGSLGDRHRVVDLDILREAGPGSLESLVGELDPKQGLAIITEGLLTYLDDATVEGLWERLAKELEPFSKGVYLADLRFARPDRGIPERAFDVVLSTFVRGQVHVYRGDETAAAATLRGAGFADVQLHPGDQHSAAGDARRDPGAEVLCIIEATAS